MTVISYIFLALHRPLPPPSGGGADSHSKRARGLIKNVEKKPLEVRRSGFVGVA